MFLHVIISAFNAPTGEWIEIGIAYVDLWNPPFRVSSRDLAIGLKRESRCDVIDGKRCFITPADTEMIELYKEAGMAGDLPASCED